MYDDVRQWTDIRIHKLGELRNIPIQTKFLWKVVSHDDELLRHVRAKNTIIVSPVEIARFAEESCGREMNGCEWRDFLDLFERKPRSLDDLALEIYWLICTVLEQSDIHHPFDPVRRVPAGIRKVICDLIQEKAATLPVCSSKLDAFSEDSGENRNGTNLDGTSHELERKD